MPASSPPVGPTLQKTLRQLGQTLRDHRKRLGVSATTAAEAAGMSRVTLHRIEKGETSVAMGAYLSAIYALGLELEVNERRRSGTPATSAPKLPAAIRLTAYPQLKKLAWQLKGTKQIRPKEALELYERNWKHIDFEKMSPRERDFVERLLQAFGRERLLV
jgi:transcriptional regulator with XRE-family HTH domain